MRARMGIGCGILVVLCAATLETFEELDACVAAGTDISSSTTGGGSDVCDATEDWFEACETIENPTCPGE